MLYLEYGKVSQGIAILQEALSLGEQANYYGAQILVPFVLSWVYGTLGSRERSLSLLNTLVEKSNKIKVGFDLYREVIKLRRGYYLGDEAGVVKKLNILEEKILHGITDVYFGSAVETLFGEVAIEVGEFQSVLAVTQEVIARMKAEGKRFLLPDLLHLRGQALHAQGRNEEALQALYEGRAEAEAQGSQRALWPILTTLTKLERQQGNQVGADQLTAEAKQVIANIADHIEEADLRSSFLNLKQVREIIGGD